MHLAPTRLLCNTQPEQAQRDQFPFMSAFSSASTSLAQVHAPVLARHRVLLQWLQQCRLVPGTWSWVVDFGQMAVPVTAKLTQDGNRVRGQITHGAIRDADEIQDGKIQDGLITFKVTLKSISDLGPQAINYRGKLDGDAIKGKLEVWWVDHPEQPHATLDWTASRVRDDTAKAN
jgi:hypothetical protein